MTGKQLVTGPSIEPVSLNEMKAHLRVFGSEEDGLLAGYILSARRHIEIETGRALISQRWRATFDGGWPVAFDGVGFRTRVVLPVAPLLAIQSVQYIDSAGATQTLSSGLYRVARVADRRQRGFIEPAHGASWPAVQSVAEAVSVTFDAGYGTGPGDVEGEITQAILLLAAHWYENREAVVIGTTVSEMPLAVERLISRYRLDI
ncbi:MAG TPA: head-tail connector protein [Dehalococcoidia bacterium]|nr:head-tail connector protein [Dehalococcoidia bacterium]